jgi:UPF0755 protein
MSELGLTMAAEPVSHRRGGPRGHRRRKRRRGRRRGGIAVVLALLVVLGLVGGGGYAGYRYLATRLGPGPDYAGAGFGAVEIEINQGDSAATIGATLFSHGVVKSVRAFSNAAKADARSNSVQPGFYDLHKHMSAHAALAMLLDPTVAGKGHVTVIEGDRVSTVLRKIAQHSELKPEDLAAAAKDPAKLGVPAWGKNDLEGFLAPGTYNISSQATATSVLSAMVKAQLAEFTTVGVETQAGQVHLTPYQVLVVASLVQKEGRVEDMPKVARVIYNRLASPDRNLRRLGFDSTVLYAKGQVSAGVLSTKDTQVASAYNTYLHEGLPPGPICAPSDAALQAALNPAPGPWTYFVTVNLSTGETKFTADPKEFETFRAELNAWAAANPGVS